MNEVELPISELLLLGGPDRAVLLDAALDAFPLGGRQLIVALGGAADELAVKLAQRDCQIAMTPAPQPLTRSWLSIRGREWRAVDVSGRAERLTSVQLPNDIAKASSVVLLNQIPPDANDRTALAIGVWANYAHPKQRTGAAMSEQRDGLAAEIALAVDPALILLTFPCRDAQILVATTDQIVAELTARSILQVRKGMVDDPVGPWEHPLIQRATELRLGAPGPNWIVASVRWTGEAGVPQAAAFAEFAERVLARIGVENRG